MASESFRHEVKQRARRDAARNCPVSKIKGTRGRRLVEIAQTLSEWLPRGGAHSKIERYANGGNWFWGR